MVSAVSFRAQNSVHPNLSQAAPVAKEVQPDAEPQDKAELSPAPLTTLNPKIGNERYGFSPELWLPIVPAVIGLVITVIDKIWPDAQPKKEEEVRHHQGYIFA